MRRLILAAGLLLALLAGCGSEEAETVRGDGYEFELPAGWEEGGDLQRAGVEAAVGDLGVRYDVLAFAEPIDGFAPNINVIVEDGIGDLGAREYAEASRASFEDAGAALPEGLELETPSEPERTALAGREAYEFEYFGAAGEQELHYRALTTVRGETGYVVTYTAPRDAFAEEVGEFAELLASWAWTAG